MSLRQLTWLRDRLVASFGAGPINSQTEWDRVARAIGVQLGCDCDAEVGTDSVRITVSHDCPTREIAAVVLAVGDLTPAGWSTIFVRGETPEWSEAS